MISMKIIKCCKCKKDKNSSEYDLFHGKVNKTCRECRSYHNKFYQTNASGYRDRRKDYYLSHKKQHRERAFRNNLKKKYGISVEIFNDMLKAQNNKCIICEDVFSRKNFDKIPQVDHDHKTGRVRGLLCKNCNLRVVPAVEWYNRYKEQVHSYLSQ